MFPYAMLATTLIFYSNDWPKQFYLTRKILNETKDENGQFKISKLSDHCIYEKKKSDEDASNPEKHNNKVFYFIKLIFYLFMY
jgi:hypothetical protein